MENMQTKKFTDIDIVNRAGLRYYHMAIHETDNLIIMGDNGYPNYYRMEIRFIAVKYLACVFCIDDIYFWRIASPEETKTVLSAFSTSLFPERDSHVVVYCLEEIGQSSQRKTRKFFIAARAVEIIAHYDANNPHHLGPLGIDK